MKQKIQKYLQNFLLTQLAITLVLLPILSNWGIELSLMSFLGNLIFLPFLTSFLLTSSLIFVTELFCIPNQFLIKTLEFITVVWNKLLGIQNKSWLISFPNHSMWILLVIAIGSLFLIKSARIKTFGHQVSLLSSTLLIMIIILKIFAPVTKSYSFEKKLFINHNNKGKLNITDNGYFNKQMNVENFIEFELKPFLISKYGTTKVNCLTLKKFSIRSFKATIQCCKLLNLQKVVLPYFNQKFNKKTFANFFSMKRLLSKNHIKFRRKLSKI